MENKYSRKHVFNRDGSLLPIKQRTYKTNEGYDCILIDGGVKGGSVKCVIEDYEFYGTYKSVVKGSIKYPMHRTIYGVGYYGGSTKDSENSKEYSKIYDTWRDMIRRCYSTVGSDLDKYKAYAEVTVHEDWHNFQNFKLWVRNQPTYNNTWRLDKDILSGRNNKIYSPDTCIFIPTELNNFMTNHQKTNSTGYVGVSWKKTHNKYVTQIKIDGEVLHLGLFEDKEEAAKAYITARSYYADIWKHRMKTFLPKYVIDKIE